MELQDSFNKIKFKETRFDLLLQDRIYNALIVSSSYDAFGLEEDGRIEEQIFNEYSSLNLRYPPRILHAETAEKALALISRTNIDLVITMLKVGEKFDAFEFAKEIKKKYPNKPVVVLTPFSREVSLRLSREDLSGIDYVFSWLGSADILLAIIKLIEDKMNTERDTKVAGVQAILLIEDSIRYYSGYLTHMYKILLSQSKKFMKEGLNEHRQMMRMRGRPKILLATNYEKANEIYEKYKNNLLGIVSDVKFPRNNKIDSEAGLRFVKKVKEDNAYLPILLQSSEIENEMKARKLKVGFLHKLSKTNSLELDEFMNKFFAFGPFEFVDPKNQKIITQCHNLRSLQKAIMEIPDNSFEYHANRNHFSKWLKARALFPIANFFAKIKREEIGNDLLTIRKFLYNAIAVYRKARARGVIAEFDRENYDDSVIFSRIGNGYIGGKARGLAFLDALIKKNPELDEYEGVSIKIPHTVAISTEVFDEFMENNDLYSVALSDKKNEVILKRFIKAKLPKKTIKDLKKFLEVTNYPIAIRSSSVLEDSHYQPFAGVYATFMIANSSSDSNENLRQLVQAVKSVYASVYYKETKAYMTATHNLIDDEKMGVVLQEVCGNKYGDRFYPTFSGVARSINFYPVENEKSDEGIVNVGLGLGKHIVEGKKSLRFSPEYPKKILQLASPETALRETQKTFYALDLNEKNFSPSTDDGVNIKSLRIKEAENDGSLFQISSVYDFTDNILREGRMYDGKRLITFANVLKYDSFPLADIIKKVLKISEKAMNNPVEIEFAVNLDQINGNHRVFNLLQIRPIVEDTADYDVSLENIDDNEVILRSESALGHGIIKDVYDIVYVKPETFDSVNNQKIVSIIERINNKLVAENKNYILVGPGRWGSSDPWLGIPVKWAHISGARLIVESGLEDYRVDPSQGTHFFQNLTSFKVGYFTINPFKNDGFFDLAYLSEKKAIYEDEFVRHVRFEDNVIIKIDGKNSKGVVMK